MSEEPKLADVNFVMQARREKLAALEAAGMTPFAYSFDPTHDAASALRAEGFGTEPPETGDVDLSAFSAEYESDAVEHVERPDDPRSKSSRPRRRCAREPVIAHP